MTQPFESYVINEKLSFTWGHIIAFLAVIAISYFTFVGVTYLTNGNFVIAAIAMAVTDLIILAVFIGLQKLKFASHKMSKRIKAERVLLFSSPVIFAALMFATAHFFTVHQRNDHVVKGFQTAINGSKGIFDDYSKYAEQRIQSYRTRMAAIATAGTGGNATAAKIYKAAGFVKGREKAHIDNGVEVLRTQLLSADFDSLRNEATRWVDNANKGANTWNVFLMGNTRAIKAAIADWHRQLSEFAAHRLADEEYLPAGHGGDGTKLPHTVPDFHSQWSAKAIDGIDALNADFTEPDFPGVMCLIIVVVLYAALLLPWLLQDRHSKSVYTIFGTKRNHDFGPVGTHLDASARASQQTSAPTESTPESTTSNSKKGYRSF